jgi:hypothetical protein
MPKYLLVLIVSLSCMPVIAMAKCNIIEDGKKTPFDGQSLENLPIEKKSLMELNKTYSKLNVIEKTFKGEILTCTNCPERYIACEK